MACVLSQGNCKTMMLATVSPAAFNATESVCTMEFAQNAAAIKKMVRVNPAGPKAAVALRVVALLSLISLMERVASLPKRVFGRDFIGDCCLRCRS